MKVLAVTLISCSLFSSAASQAQTGVGQVAASPTQDSHAIRSREAARNNQAKHQPSTSPAPYALSPFSVPTIHHA
jgi:hypothetical protein